MTRRTPRYVVPALGGVLALLLLAVPVFGDEDEVAPVIPGPGSDVPLPDADGVAALEVRLAPRRKSQLDYTKACVAGAIKKGGTGASSFGRHKAIDNGVLPECGYHLNYQSFAAFPRIYENDPAAAPGYCDKLLTVSIVLDRRMDQTQQVRLASAYGRLAHAWCRFRGGRSVDTKRVLNAAKTVREFAETHAVPAPAWRGFVMACLQAGDGELASWALEEVGRASEADPEDPASQTLALAARLAGAISLAESNPKEAKARLKELLPPLAAEGALPEDDMTLVGLYNRGVTAAQRLKLRLKTPYRTRQGWSKGGLVLLDFPRGTGWQPQVVSGKQMAGEWVKEGPAGRKVVLQIWKYSTSIDYVADDGTVIGGDNVGARARAFFESAKAEMLKVRKAKPKIRACSRALRHARGFEVMGRSMESKDLRIREWYFKTQEFSGWALNVCARETGDPIVDDPELEFVLASIREQPQKKR